MLGVWHRMEEVLVLDEGTRGVGEEGEGWDVVVGESELVVVCSMLMEMC